MVCSASGAENDRSDINDSINKDPASLSLAAARWFKSVQLSAR
jgi:hypothetical protein